MALIGKKDVELLVLTKFEVLNLGADDVQFLYLGDGRAFPT